MKSFSEDKKGIIYCGNRNCERIDCLRHNRNTPFDVLILRENYKPEKDGKCKFYLG